MAVSSLANCGNRTLCAPTDTFSYGPFGAWRAGTGLDAIHHHSGVVPALARVPCLGSRSQLGDPVQFLIVIPHSRPGGTSCGEGGSLGSDDWYRGRVPRRISETKESGRGTDVARVECVS